MNKHADKTSENKTQAAANNISKQSHRSESTIQFADNRPGTLAQRKMQEALNNSSRVQQNKTGLPDKLKNGIENLSGVSMDNTKVHYNSSKPAQLNAYAYAQGNDIHIAPGQEKHLAHEAWHVVQQKQGRVKATMQMKTGIGVNNDMGLEHEADVMGTKALQMKSDVSVSSKETNHVHASGAGIIQKQGVKEIFFEAGDTIDKLKTETDTVKTVFTSVFDAVYNAYKPKTAGLNDVIPPPSQSRNKEVPNYSQEKTRLQANAIGAKIRTHNPLVNKPKADALDSAKRIKFWSETAYQSAARIFQELHAAKQIQNGDLAGIKMGIDTRTEPDVIVKDHAGHLHAIESKRVSSPRYTQVDVNVDDASAQLQKRLETAKQQHFQAHIVVDNVENTWPYTPAAYKNALKKQDFSNTHQLAHERLKHYKDASGFDTTIPIIYNVEWKNPKLPDNNNPHNYSIT